MRLTDRVALISGGGSGIGAAVARSFAAEGAHLVVTGRRPRPIEALAAEVDGRAVPGDTCDTDHAAEAVATAVREFGGLDIVVASAGIDRGDAVGDLDDADWNQTMAVNLTGPMVLTRAALPALLERDHPSVVLVSSVNGLANAPGSAAYDASKAGLISLARSIAVDYGSRGVRANAVCPGWVRTAMGDGDMDDIASAHGISREEAYDLVTRDVPLRRPATPAEIASCCLFLASEESAYVTGVALPVDGGGLAVDISSTAFGSTTRAADAR
jgi:meso-butanediol dehydrogenase/(S,S)-butanediol dehydrogenase/diacetyl reductase